jgi:hypothetical protein
MKKDETLVIQSLNEIWLCKENKRGKGCHLIGARVQQTMNQLE